MENEILENLKKSVLEYNADVAAELAKKAVEENIDPTKALDALIVAIRKVGDDFGNGERWLPDLIGAADAMLAAMPILNAEIDRRGTKRESMGKVILGSVFGDIHNIGKSMVFSLMTADGFDVVDLGIDVPTDKFVEAVKEHEADIVAMSALLTTTAPEAQKVIDKLKEVGLREKVKVMIGGGAINADFAESIGADGYDPTAPGAVTLAKSLLGK
jgi:corrinoid protein of di/trimethylamine methyltransferase